MKIVVVGGTGTIGSAVVTALRRNHEVAVRSRSSNPPVNLDDPVSVRAMFDALGPLDAVVCCAGGAAFKPLAELSDEDFAYSLRDKLMGQVNLARIAASRVRERGSITLTSGILATRPIPRSSAVSLVNAAIEGFVRAAALEMPRGLRINVVSPPWVKETLQSMGQDPSPGMSAADVARAYVAAVERVAQGQVIDPAHPPK